MDSSDSTIPAGEFKAKCLQLMDEVNQLHKELIITKHGKPVAKLVPFEEKELPLFGCMKGTMTIHGDIMAPIDIEWDAERD